MSDSKRGVVLHGEVLPPQRYALAMPAGTPLGLGFLGAARFAAIKRVLWYYEEALRQAASAKEAEIQYKNALVRDAVADEELCNIAIIRKDEANRITESARYAAMLRQLERLELEEKILIKKSELAKLKGGNQKSAEEQPEDGWHSSWT